MNRKNALTRTGVTPAANTTSPAAAASASLAPSASAGASAPEAHRRPHRWARATGDIDDHYAWMVDTEDPELIAYLHAENAFAAGWFDHHVGLVDDIFDEIRSRVRETDQSTPVSNGGWWYVSSTLEGESYPRHHRGPTFDDATRVLLLDENAEAERANAADYFDLGALDPSHDHRFFAWSIDTTGDERYELRVRSIDSDGMVADLDDMIPDVANAGTAWSQDGAWLFYVRADEQQRPYQVWRHRIGSPSSDDVPVFTESDERFFVEIGETRTDRWIVINSGSKTSAEVRLLPSADPTAEPMIVRPRAEGVEYQVDDWGDRLVMVTNQDGAEDFAVLECETNGWTSAANWVELIAHHPGRRILDVEPFEHHLVIAEWSEAQPQLRLLDRAGSERVIEVSNEPHDVVLSSNPEWNATTLRFVSQSLTSPATLYEVDLVTGERRLLRRVPTPNVDLDRYVSSRQWATSSDGTLVPVDIVHHIDTPLDGSAPGVLYGYGSYEASMPPWFSIARLSLLDRGMVWALAHPRGGGELGRQWYLGGKLEQKQRTFDDTLATAEHLVRGAIVATDRLAIRGGSAGGLLVGACVTQRPELFAAAVAEVPFVDIVNTMSDPGLPLTVTEWEEWGDPRSEPFASIMLAYSPYDNTRPAAYPAIYVTAGLHDPRVSVHEPAKWVARLRELDTGDRPTLMHTEMGAGHGGPTGRYDAWRDEARVLAFLLTTS